MNPVPMVMCALLMCAPVPPESAPPLCPTPPARPPSADAGEADGSDRCATPTPSPSATRSPEPVREALSRPVQSSTPEPAEPRPTLGAPPRDAPPSDRASAVYRTASSPGPLDTAFRVIGNVSTGVLAVLCVLMLVLRLTVGWPRFPVPYSGQRRRGHDRSR